MLLLLLFPHVFQEKTVSHWLRLVLVATILLALPGCGTLSYYGQAVLGQTSILLKRKDIDKLIDDPATEPRLREQLRQVQLIREFARTALALPADDAYDSYVDTGRKYVVWNVFAAPEFSLNMTSFCYPIAGCVNYRGYFSQADADTFAMSLATQGQDVFVGGIAAYSTLGWFSDPVLNTFVHRQPRQLASLLFHELAHRVVYVPGDTTFNESFATAVAEAGVRRWLASQAIETDTEVFVAQRERRQDVLALIDEARDQLAGLYARSISEEEMRVAKQEIIKDLKREYETLQVSWHGHTDFAGWMASDINNARLGTIADYHALVPAFHQLLVQNDGDLSRFYQAVKQLANLPEDQRTDAVKAVLHKPGL